MCTHQVMFPMSLKYGEETLNQAKQTLAVMQT